MIVKFNQYVSESIRDKMTPISIKDVMNFSSLNKRKYLFDLYYKNYFNHDKDRFLDFIKLYLGISVYNRIIKYMNEYTRVDTIIKDILNIREVDKLLKILFNKNTNESIRNKMTPVSKKVVDEFRNNILSGNNLEIARKMYNEFYKNDYYSSWEEHLYYFVVEFDRDYIIDMTFKLFDDIEMDKDIVKNLSEDNSHLITELYGMFTGEEDDPNYPYESYLKNLILNYDSEKFKKIVKDLLDYKMNLIVF